MTTRARVGGNGRLRVAWWAASLAAAGLLLTLAAPVGFTGFMADDALYLLLADAFRHANDPLLTYVRSVAHLPPLYPAVLAMVGAGSEALARAHLLQGALALAAIVVHARWARAVSGSGTIGLWLLAMLALMPETLLLVTEIWSEFLYLLLAGLALAALPRAARNAHWWYLAALLGGLAAITRGPGLALVAALIVAAAARARRQLPGVFALGLLPLVFVRLDGHGAVGGYLDIFAARVAAPTRLWDVVMVNATAAWPGWVSLFQHRPGTMAGVVAAAMLALAVVGLLPRLRRGEADALYAVLYLGMVAMWPYPRFMARFLYPLAPLALLYAALAVQSLAARPARSRAWSSVVTGGALALVLVGVTAWSLPMLARALTPPPGALAAYRTSRYWLSPPEPAQAIADLARKQAMTIFLQGLPDIVDPHQCVHARHPAAVMLHAHRLAFPAPSGATRPPTPPCSYHLVLAERSLALARDALWPGHHVVAEARIDGQPVAQLLRYDGGAHGVPRVPPTGR